MLLKVFSCLQTTHSLISRGMTAYSHTKAVQEH